MSACTMMFIHMLRPCSPDISNLFPSNDSSAHGSGEPLPQRFTNYLHKLKEDMENKKSWVNTNLMLSKTADLFIEPGLQVGTTGTVNYVTLHYVNLWPETRRSTAKCSKYRPHRARLNYAKVYTDGRKRSRTHRSRACPLKL